MFELHFFPYKDNNNFIGQDLAIREPFDPNSSSDKMVVAMKLGLVDILKEGFGRDLTLSQYIRCSETLRNNVGIILMSINR
jgi:hypothetical protein